MVSTVYPLVWPGSGLDCGRYRFSCNVVWGIRNWGTRWLLSDDAQFTCYRYSGSGVNPVFSTVGRLRASGLQRPRARLVEGVAS